MSRNVYEDTEPKEQNREELNNEMGPSKYEYD